ncbi:MAG TPA: DUF3999 family protein [Phycisphaerae bacterium]|nr:DUF3999 family protein [Phycisphaerae bacterium]
MKRHSVTAVCLLMLTGLAAATAHADFDFEAWRTWREIRVAEGAAGEHARLALDDHVWDQAAGAGLQDLRILRGETDDIGYAVHVPEKPPVRIEERPARVFNVATRGREASELTLDLGENPPVTNRVKLQTPTENFQCPVTVEGSDDNATWKTLRDDGAVFAFTGDVAKRFTKVSFPDARMRYLRVVVGAPAGAEPIDLTGATVFQETTAEAGDLPLLVVRPVQSQTETAQAAETWYRLDLGARNLPVSKIEIETANENFSRPVRIDVGDNPKLPKRAGSGVVFRYRTTRYSEEWLEVEFGETFGRYVHVRIRNGDDPPLAVTRIVVYGRPRYVFFPFESGRSYRLFYGNRQARAPQYDYAKTFARITRAESVEARLGGVEPNPRFIATRETLPPHPWIVRNQWVLYVALGVAVIALVLVAVRALRRTPVEDGAGGD